MSAGHAAHLGALQTAAILLRPLVNTLLSLGSVFSIASLSCALLIAAFRIVGLRRARGKETRFKLLARVLFPRHVWLNASSRADLGFFVFNLWVVGLLFGWAFLSGSAIGHWTHDALNHAFGPSRLIRPPVLLTSVLATVIAYLAYEFGYWVDHYLSHEVPFLWSFHKVHHTAETLTPLTVFRVHPMETIKLVNILALTLGVTNGVLIYLFGPSPHEAQIFGHNAVLIVFVFSLAHLQHTHAWIRFEGRWAGLILSPAHHQIHHSADPAHFGKNLGSFLNIWDRAFGTLYTPSKVRPRLVFGVPDFAPHSAVGGLITPFVESATEVRDGVSSLLQRVLPVRVSKRTG